VEEWEETAKEEDLKEGIPVNVKAGKRTVLLIRSGGEIYASGAKCPHYGAPLKDGVVIDHILTCPLHTARFNVTNGRLEAPPSLDDLTRYMVKIKKGKVFVKKADVTTEPIEIKEEKPVFVIVGAGAAGNAAAITLRKEGFDGRVVMITAESVIPYDRPNLSKEYLSGELDPKWIPLKNEKFYQDLKIEIYKNEKVVSVDTEKRVLELASTETISYDRLLIATGGIPRTPDIPGVDLPNFFLLRSFGDAEAIVAALKDAEKVFVIGASFIGLEVAAALRSRGLEVWVAGPEPVLMQKVFGDRIGGLMKKLHEEHGVHFHLGCTPEAIIGDTNIKEVVLSDESRVQADVVIAGIGVVPAVDFLEDTGLLEHNAVLVDGMLKTKADGVYAAGDIALIPDPITRGVRRIEHWAEAERQGQHAARSMLGFKGEYREVPFFWTKQYDKVIKYTGFTRNYDRIVYRGEVEGGDFLAGYYRDGKLEAAAGMGKTRELIIVSEMLRAGIPLQPERFQDEGTDLRELFEKGRH